MNFLSYLKPKIKNIIGLSLLVSVISLAVSPAMETKADGPRFNFLNGDHELLRGRNDSKNEDVWKDPVGGASGDTFSGIIYYHNGVEGTVARNTKVRVTLPAQTVGNAVTLGASISADNAETVTDTVVDGQIVGQTGLTINLDQPATLEFVPGSVKWYPNVKTQGDSASTALPFSQDGSEIVSGGLNIGDINGCWDYAGYVVFKFKTKKLVVPEVTLDKQVLNISRNEQTLAKSTEAKLNEIVGFSIVVNNPGIPVSNLKLKDVLPGQLSYVSGSLEVANPALLGANPNISNPDALFDELVTTGLNIPALGTSQTVAIAFKAKVTSVPANDFVATNKAVLTYDSIVLNSLADVKLKAVIDSSIEKHKSAINTTTNKNAEPKTIDGKTILALNAKPGDEIVYSLITTSKNAPRPAYVISDDISDVLEEADLISAEADGRIVDGENIQWPARDLAVNQPVTLKFTVRIKNPLPNTPKKDGHFDDILVNIYGDEVNVFIERPVAGKSALKMEKLVRNITASENNFVKANEAFPDDELEYRINFANTGNAPADQVKFNDVLPPNTQYVAGKTVINLNNTGEKTLQDGITANGITIATISAGDTGYITFHVLVSKNLAGGEVLTNTAYLSSKDTALSDIAKTTIKAKPIAVTTTPVIPMLPKTGAGAAGSFMLTFLMGIAGTYVKFRKLIGSEIEVVKIASDLLAN